MVKITFEHKWVFIEPSQKSVKFSDFSFPDRERNVFALIEDDFDNCPFVIKLKLKKNMSWELVEPELHQDKILHQCYTVCAWRCV